MIVCQGMVENSMVQITYTKFLIFLLTEQLTYYHSMSIAFTKIVKILAQPLNGVQNKHDKIL